MTHVNYDSIEYLSLESETLHRGLGGHPHPVELVLDDGQSFADIGADALVLLRPLVGSPTNTQLEFTR